MDPRRITYHCSCHSVCRSLFALVYWRAASRFFLHHRQVCVGQYEAWYRFYFYFCFLIQGFGRDLNVERLPLVRRQMDYMELGSITRMNTPLDHIRVRVGNLALGRICSRKKISLISLQIADMMTILNAFEWATCLHNLMVQFCALWKLACLLRGYLESRLMLDPGR